MPARPYFQLLQWSMGADFWIFSIHELQTALVFFEKCQSEPGDEYEPKTSKKSRQGLEEINVWLLHWERENKNKN